MGGDHGPSVTVPATAEFLRSDGDASAILVGRPEDLEPYVAPLRAKFGERMQVHAASEVVAMDEPPAGALRGKKDSSMRVAICRRATPAR